ncbi:DUF6838 family protein [Paenibacillus sp. PAMC21692]|uniref:phage tail terminator family protein n=1 Tax=Paenibacillus sp. PAMC21692 TaxID=2762320 RepID=UPI00164D1EB0|nr:hypothetical protein [Paenibacillus sp. PAMC21692]QNK57554.1 hypothetical protein H7F31_00790 [Paenibacillus sp. PAMC21692]
MAVTANSIRTGMIAMLAAKLPAYDVIGDAPASVDAMQLLVELPAVSQTAMLGNMCSRTFGFAIHYSDGGGGAAELHGVAEQLYEALDQVDLGGVRYRTTNMRHEVADGKLAFRFEMVMRLRRTEQELPKMGALEQEAGVK